MKLIFENKQGQAALSLDTREWRVRLLLLCVTGVLLVAGALGLRLVDESLKAGAESRLVAQWHEQLQQDNAALFATREQVDLELAR